MKEVLGILAIWAVASFTCWLLLIELDAYGMFLQLIRDIGAALRGTA